MGGEYQLHEELGADQLSVGGVVGHQGELVFHLVKDIVQCCPSPTILVVLALALGFGTFLPGARIVLATSQAGPRNLLPVLAVPDEVVLDGFGEAGVLTHMGATDS